MKYFLLSILLVISLQRFVLQHTRKSCKGEIIQGVIMKSDICFRAASSNNFYQVQNNRTSCIFKNGCEITCKRCSSNNVEVYGCKNQTNIALEYLFGEPKPITDTGFYLNHYYSMESCKRGALVSMTSYVIKSQCMSNGFLGFSGRSQKIGYHDDKNAVLIEEFDQINCQGDSRAVKFPIGECVEIHSTMFIKAVRKFE